MSTVASRHVHFQSVREPDLEGFEWLRTDALPNLIFCHKLLSGLAPRLSSHARKLPVHLPQHDIHASQNDYHVGHVMAQAHVFQNGQVDQTRRTDAVTIRVRPAIADEVEA